MRPNKSSGQVQEPREADLQHMRAAAMHVAAGVGTPTLAIVGNDAEAVGASPIRLWLPRSSSLTRTVSSSSCSLCSDNRFRNDGCLADTHHCMDGVDAQQVICWLEAKLA